jgi:hypothetical protein
VPIGLAVSLLAPRRLGESRGPARRLDLPGVPLITAGAAVTIWSMIRGGDAGWGSP